MDKDKLEETLSTINLIDKKKIEIENNLSNLPILPRKEILVQITNEIINKHQIFKEKGISKEDICASDSADTDSITILLDNLISNIKKTPSKKVLYLRLFLDRFHEISEQDKNVIIQSIKEIAVEDLKEKLLSLISVFKLEV